MASSLSSPNREEATGTGHLVFTPESPGKPPLCHSPSDPSVNRTGNYQHAADSPTNSPQEPKIEASRQKQSGKADDISDVYSTMKLSERDIPGLVAFLKLLEDVPDDRFRKLILEAKVLDTSETSDEP